MSVSDNSRCFTVLFSVNAIIISSHPASLSFSLFSLTLCATSYRNAEGWQYFLAQNKML